MKARNVLALVAGGLLLTLGACSKAPLASVSERERELIASNLMRDIEVLASDEFGGRLPGTLGGEKTIAYLTERMQAVGLVSGTNDPGSAWRAPVRLLSTKPFTSRVEFTFGRKRVKLDPQDAAAFTSSRRALAERAEMVFAGPGAKEIAAPFIRGKVVILLGTPEVSTERRAALFANDPAAIITVVGDTGVISALEVSFGSEQLRLAREDLGALNAFVTETALADALGNERWRALVEASDVAQREPIAVSGTVTIEATSQRREFTSYNVIGKLPGTEPQNGALLLLAHWDHLGECGPPEAADRICNGAIDNASGVAVMLELARRLKASGPHKRDIYVLATSAEEAGLLGARSFAASPPVPLSTFVAAFNFDTVALAPAESPLGFVGQGRTPLDGIIFDVMEAANRRLGDQDFAAQFVQRQDGWVLLQKGVPTVFLSSAFGSADLLNAYLDGPYHSPADEIDQVELGGAIDDLLLHSVLIKRIADPAQYLPNFSE
ncbi:MAG: M20/M25/M40 family metallo-hydrolase [Pseudomonadota bacterium]